MYTEKLTLYIGRDPATQQTDKQWHARARQQCAHQVRQCSRQ